MNAATEAHLQTDIPALMEKAGMPGLSIAVIRDGRRYGQTASASEVKRRRNR